ncbi:unnamed protein product [Cuscuta europaea]|uniref:Uncharacterized protein n=1 Tax=Cuscuta europaea TaxID=41803 RepID=A0A9P0ZJL8_CUSEU|nr:unnamed protein product [Cuscuta europaea]
MSSLQRLGTTRWGSHYESILSMIEMFNATCTVLMSIACDSPNPKARIEADGVCTSVKSFDFVFGLHLMEAVMRITDFVCQALQRDNVDILSAIGFVETAKDLLQKLRNEGWDNLFEKVKQFCLQHEINVSDMMSKLMRGRKEVDMKHCEE